MPKPFNQTEFDAFLEKENIHEIQKVPGFIWLLYTEEPNKNEWLLKFWFTHQENNDALFWETLLRVIEAMGLTKAEKAQANEALEPFMQRLMKGVISGKVLLSHLNFSSDILSLVNRYKDKDDHFWDTFFDLVNAIGWQRVYFYAQHQRLEILMDWVKTGKLSLDQVKEYDTVDSYQEKPLANAPAVNVPPLAPQPPVEPPTMEAPPRLDIDDDDKTVVPGYRPPKNQTYHIIKKPQPVAKKEPANVPPKKPVIPPFRFKDYELRLTKQMYSDRPLSDVIYFTLENGQIKYRTYLTPGEELVVLEGEIAKEEGELYLAIKEGKLRQLDPLCKKNLLKATFQKGHTEETGQRRYERTVSRKLPHLLASDTFDNPERPLTTKERARFDMDEEDPRYHSSRHMSLGMNIKREFEIASYLRIRYYEEYLEDFFDKVIIPLAEERVRLFDALKVLLDKMEDSTHLLSPQMLEKLQKRIALLEEKVDVLSGCIKQQCCALKKVVVQLGEERIHGSWGTTVDWAFPLLLAPLKIYQQTKPKAERGFEFKKDDRYRLQRLERLPKEEITPEKLRDKAEKLDNVPLQPVKSKVNPLTLSQNEWKDLFKVLAGVAYGIVTSALLIPRMTWEALKEWWRSSESTFYPKVREGFNGTFFRTHSHQACFEAQKNTKEVFSPHLKALDMADHVAYDNQRTFTGSATQKSLPEGNYREFRDWEQNKHTQRALR